MVNFHLQNGCSALAATVHNDRYTDSLLAVGGPRETEQKNRPDAFHLPTRVAHVSSGTGQKRRTARAYLNFS